MHAITTRTIRQIFESLPRHYCRTLQILKCTDTLPY